MAHLHMHSTYSELDAISKVKDIVKRLKEYGHETALLSDHGTIAGVPEFYNECKKAGLKPILGSEFYFMPDPAKAKEEKSRKNHHLILMAMNDEGWRNIRQLTTKANKQFYYAPRIGYDDLREHSNGLICLTACLKGIVPYNVAEENYDEAFKHAQILHNIFGDRFYLEVQDGGLDVQIRVNKVLRRMAAKLEVPVVGCQDAHYVDRDDVEGHEGIWAVRTYNTFDDPIGYGPREDVEKKKTRPYYSTREYWLKDAHHMLNEELTTENGEKRLSTLKQSEIEESARIADRIGEVSLGDGMHLPKFEFIPNADQVGCAVADECISLHSHPGDLEGEVVDRTSFNFLCELVAKGYEKVYQTSWLDRSQEHRERLSKELTDIKNANLADYFLIVWDVVSWCLSQNIPVGVGRGCLTDKSYVYTINGFKSIKDVSCSDKVVNSDGKIVDVVNTSNFDVDEEIVEVKTYYDFWSNAQFTKDHKILIKRGRSPNRYKKTPFPSNKENSWVRTDELRVGDFVCIPKMNHYDHDKDSVSYWTFENDELSIDNDFAKFIGLWIGDGCYKAEAGISIFLSQTDKDALEFLDNYLMKIGVRHRKYSPKNKDTLIIYDIQSRAINKMFKSLFGEVYSQSKFIPESFFFSRSLMEGILVGLIWSDGSLSENRVSFDTISERLVFDLRRLLYYLSTPSSVYKREFENGYQDSYKLRLAKSETVCRLFGLKESVRNTFFEDNDYVYCAIRELNQLDFSGKVYDLAVSGDSPSFLTGGGYVVHNSAAGSMVSYCLGITGIDPLKYGLIWERFYNAGRKGSLADIDVDVSKQDRPCVIEYITQRYGEDRVAQIVTFGTLKTKAALKDAARVLGNQGGMSPDDANVMTRLVPEKHGQPLPLEEALEESEKLREYEKKYPRLFTLARKLEGCQRGRGVHAAGVVIADEPFEEGFPLRWNTKEKKLVTEMDMETLEKLGYLKLDILGIDTLGVLKDVEDIVNAS